MENHAKDRIITTLVRLGTRMDGFGGDPALDAVIDRAVRENPWFTRDSVLRAIRAIREEMLAEDRLRTWLDHYPDLPAAVPRRVAVIAAGNIPLVGFADLLYVLAAGHTCLLKTSSKDRALMEWVAGTLREIDPQTGIEPFAEDGIPDAVIATGSDNTNRYFRSRFRGIPAVLRGSRTSVAVLSGRETPQQLTALADDIFAYCGLGCRNVSHQFVPHGYDTATLAARLSAYAPPNPRYAQNHRQRRAVLTLQDIPFTEGGFFSLRESPTLPAALSEITFQRYRDVSEPACWLAANDPQIQCVACDGFAHPRAVAFGRTQSPTLSDYPDGMDIAAFLAKI